MSKCEAACNTACIQLDKSTAAKLRERDEKGRLMDGYLRDKTAETWCKSDDVLSSAAAVDDAQHFHDQPSGVLCILSTNEADSL